MQTDQRLIKLKVDKNCHRCKQPIKDECIELLIGWPNRPTIRHYHIDCCKEPFEPINNGILYKEEQ
jgi:hypothetical protein